MTVDYVRAWSTCILAEGRPDEATVRMTATIADTFQKLKLYQSLCMLLDADFKLLKTNSKIY